VDAPTVALPAEFPRHDSGEIDVETYVASALVPMAAEVVADAAAAAATDPVASQPAADAGASTANAANGGPADAGAAETGSAQAAADAGVGMADGGGPLNVRPLDGPGAGGAEGGGVPGTSEPGRLGESEWAPLGPLDDAAISPSAAPVGDRAFGEGDGDGSDAAGAGGHGAEFDVKKPDGSPSGRPRKRPVKELQFDVNEFADEQLFGESFLEIGDLESVLVYISCQLRSLKKMEDQVAQHSQIIGTIAEDKDQTSATIEHTSNSLTKTTQNLKEDLASGFSSITSRLSRVEEELAAWKKSTSAETDHLKIKLEQDVKAEVNKHGETVNSLKEMIQRVDHAMQMMQGDMGKTRSHLRSEFEKASQLFVTKQDLGVIVQDPMHQLQEQVHLTRGRVLALEKDMEKAGEERDRLDARLKELHFQMEAADDHVIHLLHSTVNDAKAEATRQAEEAFQGIKQQQNVSQEIRKELEMLSKHMATFNAATANNFEVVNSSIASEIRSRQAVESKLAEFERGTTQRFIGVGNVHDQFVKTLTEELEADRNRVERVSEEAKQRNQELKNFLDQGFEEFREQNASAMQDMRENAGAAIQIRLDTVEARIHQIEESDTPEERMKRDQQVAAFLSKTDQLQGDVNKVLDQFSDDRRVYMAHLFDVERYLRSWPNTLSAVAQHVFCLAKHLLNAQKDVEAVCHAVGRQHIKPDAQSRDLHSVVAEARDNKDLMWKWERKLEEVTKLSASRSQRLQITEMDGTQLGGFAAGDTLPSLVATAKTRAVPFVSPRTTRRVVNEPKR